MRKKLLFSTYQRTRLTFLTFRHILFGLLTISLFLSIAPSCISTTLLKLGRFASRKRGSFGENRLKLTYYFYEYLQANSQPLAVYESQQNQWSYDHALFKGNNHSKIIWFREKQEQQITFNYYELQQNNKGKITGIINTVKAVITLGDLYGVSDMQISIGGIWEVRKNNYHIWAIACKYQNVAQKSLIKNNYILSTELANDNGVLRESKVDFGKKNEDIFWSERLIDCFGVGNISLFHTFDYQKGVPVQSPVYYVNNLTEEIVYQSSWKCSCYESNYYLPGWDGNTFIQTHCQNGDVEQIRVTVIKLISPKETSLHFLLNLYEDFDDDLLQDTIDLLHSD